MSENKDGGCKSEDLWEKQLQEIMQEVRGRNNKKQTGGNKIDEGVNKKNGREKKTFRKGKKEEEIA